MGVGNWLVGKVGRKMSKRTKGQRSYLCDFDRICYELRPADVILVEGKNYVSRIIRRITHSPWTHAALYIGRLHDIEDPMLREIVHKNYGGRPSDQLVIESIVGRGTIVNNITHYQNDHLRICRPSGLSHQDSQKVIAYAINSIGKKYNVRHFFDLGRFLFASHLIPRRWKSSLFNNHPGQATKDVCSVMIANAFASVQFPIIPLIREDEKHHVQMIRRNPKLFTPSDFDYSPYFNIIKYPIFPVSHHAPYRQLPWEKGVVYSDEIGVTESLRADEVEITQQEPEEPHKQKIATPAKEDEHKSNTKPTKRKFLRFGKNKSPNKQEKSKQAPAQQQKDEVEATSTSDQKNTESELSDIKGKLFDLRKKKQNKKEPAENGDDPSKSK